MEDRETALWKMQETFGWTISPDVDLSWGDGMIQGSKKASRRPATAGAKTSRHRLSHSPYGKLKIGHKKRSRTRLDKKGKGKGKGKCDGERASSAEKHGLARPNTANQSNTVKWSSRLLQVPNDIRKRGLPQDIRAPHPTLGGAVRFLGHQKEHEESRFAARYSTYYSSSPYPVEAPSASRESLQEVTKLIRGRGGKTIPDEDTKEWLRLQSVTMHGGSRSRGLAINPFGLSPPKASRCIEMDLSSATSNRFHARALGRRLFFRMKHPKKIPSLIRGELHIVMMRHSFEAVPPANWPKKKKIGRREGARVVNEWRGATKDVWELLENINSEFGGKILISCDDFYLLERAHMWCRTFQEGSMPVAQRHKLVQLGIVEDEDDLLWNRSSNNTPTDSNRAILQHVGPRKKRSPRSISTRKADVLSLPMKDPADALSHHRRSTAVNIAVANRFEKVESVTGRGIGPGSFVFPTSLERQVESRKRNLRFTAGASMSSPLKRMQPEDAAPLGFREGPGPAHYATPERTISGGIKMGPGFTSDTEPHMSLQCKRLMRPWMRKDEEMQRAQSKLDREMRRIQAKEAELVLMSRGLRSIISQRIEKESRNGDHR